MYSEEECLPLSGIQHIAFCPRQFALIHIECQWLENALTFDGRIMHDSADDPFSYEARGTVLITRAVPLVSANLGLYGVADVVEFRKCDFGGVPLDGREGLWKPYPVEYKRGRPKQDDRDAVQVCAQAMCLEEMLGVSVDEGALFYGKTRRRQVIKIDAELRTRVEYLAGEMHRLYEGGITPPPRKTSACESCSVAELCLPGIGSKRSSKAYLADGALEEPRK
ncbi:MAG: CRISPR-associated protein Cas4 [Betaproteobacteria bacterium]